MSDDLAPTVPAPEPRQAPGAWSLRSAAGRDLRVSFAIDPVMDLRAWAMAGHRIEPRIVEAASGAERAAGQRLRLAPQDLVRIGLAGIGRGVSRLEGADGFERPRLIVQLSFQGLDESAACAALTEGARRLQPMLRQAAICELADVDAGIAVGRLAEAAGRVRGLFRSLWMQVPPRRRAIEAACAARASGLTVRAFALGQDPPSIAAGLRAFRAGVKRPNLLLTVTSLPTADLMIEAMAAGFTHATLRAPRPAASAPARAAVYVD